jgi:hypothetical protein
VSVESDHHAMEAIIFNGSIAETFLTRGELEHRS